MSKEKDIIAIMEWFKDTDVWKIMCEYLDNYKQNRVNVLLGLTGELALDFEQHYSKHDLMRSDIRLIELVFKKLPEVIIEEEQLKRNQKSMEEEANVQAQIDAMSELV